MTVLLFTLETVAGCCDDFQQQRISFLGQKTREILNDCCFYKRILVCIRAKTHQSQPKTKTGGGYKCVTPALLKCFMVEIINTP